MGRRSMGRSEIESYDERKRVMLKDSGGVEDDIVWAG